MSKSCVASLLAAFFEVGGHRVAALDLGYGLIGPGNPARRGQRVQLFANGLGPLTQQPNSGSPAPVSPLAQTRTLPAVTMTAKTSGI
jgi:uncharacterized protein (TIGR03437 family)